GRGTAPRRVGELIPDSRGGGCRSETDSPRAAVAFLWERGRFALPLVPPMLDNHGCHILSLGNLVEWLAKIAEAKGVLIATETPAARAIIENGRVAGVVAGDKGLNKEGERKPNYQPGAECRAKATVLCEGPRGTIAKSLEGPLGLTAGRNAQVYSTGVKELWELPPGRVEKGRVIHTLGHPLPAETFGGGFVYGMNDT